MWTKLADVDLLDAGAQFAPDGEVLGQPEARSAPSVAGNRVVSRRAGRASSPGEPVTSPASGLAAPAPRVPADERAPAGGPAPSGDPVAGPDEPVQLEVGDGLTERERQMLAFEKQWWRQAGAKEQAIRDVFDLSATRYYQMLNALLENPAALQYDPILVGRLRRMRATRSRSRGRMTPRNAA